MRCFAILSWLPSVALLAIISYVLVSGASSCAAEPPVTSLAFSLDGKAIVAASQSGLKVLSWPDLKIQRRVSATSVNIHDVAFSPTGDRLAVVGGTPSESGEIEVLSWPSLRSLQKLRGHKDSIMSVLWKDETTLASASLDHTVGIWNLKAAKLDTSLKGHSRGVSSLSFLSAKKVLVSGGLDQSLRVWDESGKLVRSLTIHTQLVHAVRRRPGDHGLPMVASISDDKTVRLWQPTIGRMVRFAKLKSKPLDVVWLADGTRIAVCCADGHTRVIDAETVKVTQAISAVAGWAYSIAAHPTDRAVVVGGTDGQLRQLTLRDK